MGNILSDTDGGLLTANNCALAFIDHQPQMSFGVASGIDRQLLVNNVLLLAKGAKLFGVPTILTTVETESFSGPMWPQLLDVFPTLCDLTGVPAPANLQGKSLRPLLNDAKATIHDAAFTQARRGENAEFWGRTVRTSRWRCTEWDEGKNGLELYNHDADPHEFTNLAGQPEYAAVLRELRGLLATRLNTQKRP